MQHRWVQLALMGVGAVLLLGLVLLLNRGSIAPGWALDWLWENNGPYVLPVDAGGNPASAAVVIIAVDNDSLRLLRGTRDRLPRSIFGNIVASLTDLGAKTIGFDVTFEEPGVPEEDAVLIDAVARSKRVVTNCYLVHDDDITRLGVRGRSFFRQHGVSEGLADIDLDRDNFLRRTRLYYRRGDLPCRISFALAMFLTYQGTSLEDIRFEGDTIFLPLPPPGSPPLPFPLDPEGRALIGFLGGPGTLQTISAMDLLQGKVPRLAIEGKAVLIGGTADEFRDSFHTPFSPKGTMPGVEIHGHIIASLLAQDVPYELGSRSWKLILFALAVLTSIASGWLRAEKSLLLLLPAAIAWMFGNVWLFSQTHIFVNPVDVWAAMGAGWVSSTLLDAWIQRQEKLRISNLFGQYVSPNLLKELMEHPESLALGGARRQAVVLFADVRGFTHLCEERPPEEVITLLNTYFSSVTNAIFEHHGVLDKYIGDGLMAFFGVPLSHGNEAENAVRAALGMRQALHRLRAQYPSGADFPIEAIGIGINAGEVVVGNVGSQSHMEYTLLGDTVNVAARLETLCRSGEILVSSLVAKQLPKGVFEILSKGPTPIRGRAEMVEVFEIKGENS